MRLSTEVDFGDRWLEVLGRRMSLPDDPDGRFRRRMGFSMYVLGERNPVFAPDEPTAETAALLRALGVEFLVAPASEVPRLDRLNELEPGAIEPLLARDGLAILRVRLEKTRK